MMDKDQLLAECLKLDPAERARLIDELQATLPPDLGAVGNEWPDEYRDEITRRVESVRNGEARLMSQEEFMAKLATALP